MGSARIQIAGVRNLDEAKMLIERGVDDVGFPLGPGIRDSDLSEEEAKEIIQKLEIADRAVWITYLSELSQILERVKKLGAMKIQLHGEVNLPLLEGVKRERPDLFVIKSLIVRGDNLESLKKFILKTNEFVDAYLTDTFDPRTGHCGATGKTHDWNLSKKLVDFSPRPIILAGGLTPENIEEALATVRPYGIDAHTGVEDVHGHKDPFKIAQFVAKAKAS